MIKKISEVAFWLGVLFLPFIFSWFTLQKKYSKKSKAIAFVWLAFFVLAGTVHKDKKRVEVANESDLIAPVKAPILQANVKEILLAYKNNEIGADNRYKGRQVEVSGTVIDIKKGLMGNMYVTIGTGSKYEIRTLQAFFDDSMSAALSQLNHGDQLTVVCTIDGLMINVLAKKCTIKNHR